MHLKMTSALSHSTRGVKKKSNVREQSQLQDVSVTDDSRILTNLLIGLGMPHIGTPHTHISLTTALTDARQYLARQ